MPYYLPCDCGARSIVDANQCGRTISCQCGRTLEVPPLRELRQLAPAVATTPAAAPRGWNPARGVALVALAPLVAAAAYGLYAFRRPPPPPPPYPSLEGRGPREILYQDWFPLVERGIDDSFIPAVQNYVESVDRWRDSLLAAGIIAALSLVTALVGLFWPRRGVATPGRPPARRR
jgi:hypothetical protein